MKEGEQRAERILKITAEETSKLVKDIKKDVVEGADEVATAFAEGIVNGFKEAIFGQSESTRLRNDIRKKIRTTENKKGLFGTLLKDVQDQTQEILPPVGKAHLYVELVNYVNREFQGDEKKSLLFIIAHIASQDKKLIEDTNYLDLFHKTTSYFNTTIRGTLPDDIAKAFEKNDFSSLGPKLTEDLNRYIETLPRLLLDTSKICPLIEGWQSISSDNDIPIGTVIAYASDNLPLGYVRCDGSRYPKDEYGELYTALGNPDIQDGKFKVPDYGDYFLRGTNDPSEIGKGYKDTTKMPNKPFHVSASGGHGHETFPDGEHTHTSDLAGKHSHTLDPSGKHTHTVSKSGEHKHGMTDSVGHSHAIHQGGEHNHGMDATGQHNHINGPHDRFMKVDNQFTVANTNPTVGEPNLVHTAPSLPAGQHVHTIHQGGVHSHGMDKAGIHNHTIIKAGNHSHTLSSVAAHTHKASETAAHTHKILPKGSGHMHKIAKSGEHAHKIMGGDTETSPKNVKVAYLIKAKPTIMLTNQVKDLQDEIQGLKKELEGHPTETKTVLESTVAAVVVVAVLKKLGIL